MINPSIGVATFNIGQFLGRYPEFSQVDPGKLQGYFYEAGLFLTNTPTSLVQNVQRRTWLLYMLVAHISYLHGDLDATTITPVAPSVQISVYAPAPGPFAIAHNLGVIPNSIEILPSSPGAIWESQPADTEFLYLSASDSGVTATVSVFQDAEVASSGGSTRPVGRTSQASEGSVSASFDYMAATAAGGAWFNQSPYGAEFWQATSSLRGMRYIMGFGTPYGCYYR